MDKDNISISEKIIIFKDFIINICFLFYTIFKRILLISLKPEIIIIDIILLSIPILTFFIIVNLTFKK